MAVGWSQEVTEQAAVSEEEASRCKSQQAQQGRKLALLKATEASEQQAIKGALSAYRIALAQIANLDDQVPVSLRNSWLHHAL